jgi:hypothetical protein
VVTPRVPVEITSFGARELGDPQTMRLVSAGVELTTPSLREPDAQ